MIADDAALRDAIQGYVAAAGGAQAISYVHRSLQSDGWRGLGTLEDFADRVRRLGFGVRYGKGDRGGPRREVHCLATATCGAPHPRTGRRCVLAPGHGGYHWERGAGVTITWLSNAAVQS